MKSIEKATNNMKMVYVDLCLALGYLLQNNQIYQKRIDNMVYYGVIAK